MGVTFLHPMLPRRLHGGEYGASYQILAWWNCLESASVTLTARQLNVHPDLVQKWYDTCRDVIADDAVYLQSQIKHGGHAPITVDIEADESVFFKWKVPNDDPEKTQYFYWVWLGVIERGKLDKL